MGRTSRTWHAFTCVVMIALPMLPAGSGRGEEPGGAPFPTRPIRIMAPASPGGGWDQTARAMQTALARSSGQNVQVYNVTGAGGTVGLAQFAHDHAGDPHQLMVGGLVMLGATQMNRSPVTLEDVTPIASLTTEWEAVVVPADSKYQTFRQLIADFKANPTGISWGGGSAGGTDHILVGLIAREVGVAPSEVNYVAFSGGGEAQIAMLSGAVTAGVSGVSESRDQVEAGRLRRLAVSSGERLQGVDAPTIKEAGIDVTLANWRGVFAPPGLNDEQRTAVSAALAMMRDTEEWREALRKRGWDDFFKTGDEFSAFLHEEQLRVQAVALRDGYSPVGPWFFPAVVVAGLAALGTTFLLRATVFRPAKPVDPVAGQKSPTSWPTVGLTVLALVVYALALSLLGYVVATALFFPAVAGVLGSRRLVRDLVIGLGLSVTIYLVFAWLLEVRLPAGLLADWLTKA